MRRMSSSLRTRQAEVVAALGEVLPRTAILFHGEDTAPYECDALTAYRTPPMAVVLPETEAQVAATLRICHRLGVPIVARGAGTGLSGGATPHRWGVVLSLAKFTKILKIDAAACNDREACRRRRDKLFLAGASIRGTPLTATRQDPINSPNGAQCVDGAELIVQRVEGAMEGDRDRGRSFNHGLKLRQRQLS